MKRQIVLASQSPRRRELLTKCKVPFLDVKPNSDETIRKDMPLNKAITELAVEKAESVFSRFPQAVVIGADTIVVYDNEILGKPKDEEDAFYMLQKLSGKKHTVITGVAIISEEERVTFYDETLVEFFDLSTDMINDYIRSKEPMDKAGAYGIHEGGGLFVKRIEGDFYSVMGLPIARVYNLLQKYL